MIERESRVKEVYSSAQDKTEMFAEGEFFCHLDGSYSSTGKLNIEARYVNSNSGEITVPQAEIHITYSPHDKRGIEYIIDPNNFSQIAIIEEPRKGLFSKFSKPKTVANENDIAFLYELLNSSRPSGEFAQNLIEGRRKVEEANRVMKLLNQRIMAEIKTRETEEFWEKKAQREAKNILQEITPDYECLAIVIDDYAPKFDGEHGLLRDYERSNIGNRLFFTLLSESGYAVRVVSHIMHQRNKSNRNIPIIIFMDGDLERCKYTTGTETANVLRKRLEEMHLPMPYLVGNSNDDFRNKLLQKENPDCYITSFDSGDAGWSAIAEVINGN